ncbi:lanthionine synthetase LanC family protein [Embleya scabrispora]|uniref:class III lanthionine synthetase LanKC N-terminal domain-containing protein n=1 Tax=Embleya scabrispora TaxID=159449 RepID=UPI00035CD538|nr:lanthionine synthetase LanC family protein [Embleya scabrispora]MYS85846.1 protein kinase [Streptomyces sp. SID5474]
MATTTRGHRAERTGGHGAPGTNLVDRVRAALDRAAVGAREQDHREQDHDGRGARRADAAGVLGGSGALGGSGSPGSSGAMGTSSASSASGGASGASGADAEWDVRSDDFWCTVRPPGHAARAQGWKIHVSARTGDAPHVLGRVCDVLLPRRVAFKFAGDLERLRMLNSREADRASAGKFITVYPNDDEQFMELVDALDEVTRELTGPGILSDRPCRPGSVVHYRYGGFGRRAVLGNDGGYRAVLTDPDGLAVDDAREAWFTPPAWAPDPLAERARSTHPARPAASSTPGVLIAGRFAVTSALRHSAKGGVFLGRDTTDDTAVVVKQARAHIEVDRSGRDACAALRHEAVVMRRLAHTGLTPRHVALVEEAETVFLAQERVPGEPLRAWVGRHAQAPDVPWALARPVVRELIRVVETVHGENLVIRDLSPTNVLVASDHSVRLVDLELAAEIGSLAGAAGTPGYRAPEQRPTADGGHLVHPTADLYSLGGLFFLLATGADPALPEDVSASRGTVERLGAWLASAARHGETARRLAPAIRGLWQEDPTARWSLERVRGFVVGATDGGPGAVGAGSEPGLGSGPGGTLNGAAGGGGVIANGDGGVGGGAGAGLGPDAGAGTGSGTDAGSGTGTGTGASAGSGTGPGPGFGVVGRQDAPDGPRPHPDTEGDKVPPHPQPPEEDVLLLDGLAHLVATMTPGRVDRLWPMTAGAAAMDPCSVQYGAAGVLGVLARAAHTTTLEPRLRYTLHRAVEDGAVWLRDRAAAEPVVLPGLHFGRSGTAWALYDAAALLGDEALAASAIETALRVPIVWPNPDVCHGAAGAGLLQVRMWRATGDERFRQRALACADALSGAARQAGDLTLWPVPKDFDSRLAGAAHLGFAHGVAGVGAFLLDAALATGREGCLDGARAAARTLTRTVRTDGDTAWWPQGPGDPAGVRLAHWCSGSAGVGTFLIRLWQADGDPQHRELAEQAGAAVHRARWHSGTTACHGLAGNGEFLLDLAEALDDSTHRARAADLAEQLRARTALIDGLRVPADESAIGVSASYGTGTAGVLGFLLRLGHGGARLWLDGEDA